MPCSSTFTGIPPGVVTGNDYRTLMKACRHGRYALPAINVTSSSMINAVLEAAASNRSDVIIQISSGGAQFYSGGGLRTLERARTVGALAMARHVHLLAKEYGIAVILHTDHAHRPLIPWVNDLIALSQIEYAQTGRPLFSSHMLDLSAEPIDVNLHEAERMLKRLAPLGMGLEIELGITGGEEDGIGHEFHADDANNPALYTQPDDVLKAWKHLSPLGPVSIAAAFGNVHGVYKPGNVKLRPDILQKAQELTATECHTLPNPIPFVFHGGSGSEIDKIQHAVSYGVFKMNIDTDTQFAFAQGVGNYVHQHSTAFQHQITPDTGRPLKKEYDPRQWLRAGELSCIARLDQAFSILNAKGRSLART